MKLRVILKIACIVILTTGRAIAVDSTSNYETVRYTLALSKMKDWPRIKGEMRDFLWNHWENKRVGRLIVTSYTKEGDSKTSVCVIEPDKQGVWRIQICEKSQISALVKKPRVKIREFEAYKLQKLPLKKDDQVRGKSYYLKMMDKNGEVLGQW